MRDPAFKVEETLPDSVWGCSQRVCDRNTVKILFGGLRPATNEDHSGKVWEQPGSSWTSALIIHSSLTSEKWHARVCVMCTQTSEKYRKQTHTKKAEIQSQNMSMSQTLDTCLSFHFFSRCNTVYLIRNTHTSVITLISICAECGNSVFWHIKWIKSEKWQPKIPWHLCLFAWFSDNSSKCSVFCQKTQRKPANLHIKDATTEGIFAIFPLRVCFHTSSSVRLH